MKNALILHGTNSNSQDNWFPWLKTQLESIGYQVWTPDLPQAEKPNIKRYNQHIFANQNFEISEETLLIGHSSGAVAVLGLRPVPASANRRGSNCPVQTKTF